MNNANKHRKELKKSYFGFLSFLLVQRGTESLGRSQRHDENLVWPQLPQAAKEHMVSTRVTLNVTSNARNTLEKSNYTS